MKIITSGRDLFYERRLDRVYSRMERILERELIDYKKAINLISEYSFLVESIRRDITFKKSERDFWHSKLIEDYDPMYNSLKSRVNFLLLQ